MCFEMSLKKSSALLSSLNNIRRKVVFHLEDGTDHAFEPVILRHENGKKEAVPEEFREALS
jgi:hypothetical protein